MRDIWSFLLQTLTVSTTALIILIIKRIFRDKLTPLWQFSLWSVFGLALLIPAGLSWRFTLYNWASLTEFLKTFLLEEYTASRIYAFFPIPDFEKPENIFDTVFLIYFLGVLFFIIKYSVSFIKLRRLLKKADATNEAMSETIRTTAEKYSLPICKSVTLKGLSSPFICGLFSPVLVLPENETDEKIIIHELLHLKHKDVLWGIIISVFRSIHWCNPFLWFIFNKINNDIEELCDSRVLSVLEGEERREYGNILLSMANKKYASFPGTSSVANGGKNISSRIKTIVRFNKYPISSPLAGICIILLVSSYLLIGVNAQTVNTKSFADVPEWKIDYIMATARTNRCSTPAGAIDTYTKAILRSDGILRAYSAPLAEHKPIAREIKENLKSGNFPLWNNSLNDKPKSSYKYYIYNFRETEKNVYSAYISFELIYNSPDIEKSDKYIAYQEIEIRNENGRWVVIPLDEFQKIITYKTVFDNGSCSDLPSYCFSAETENFRIEQRYQYILTVGSVLEGDSELPRLNAYFSYLYIYDFLQIFYTGDEDKKESIESIDYGFKEMNAEDEFPEFDFHGGSSSVYFHENNEITGGGGGGFASAYDKKYMRLPDQIACEFRCNREPYQKLILTREDDNND